jgi:tetratricopeptide (TPR) repeat protein
MTRADRYLFNVYHGDHENIEGALRVARDASELYPREFAYSRGMLALAMDRTGEAVAAFKLLEREEGGFREEYVQNWPFYFDQYSDALHRLGEHEKELEVVLEGRRRFPDYPLLIQAESAARIALGQEEEIRAVIAEERREGNTDRVRLIAWELFAHDLPELAREVVADELDRFDTDPYYNDPRRVAEVLHMLGRDEEAMAIYREVAEAHPNNPWQGHYQMGIVAASLGDTALALEIDRSIADWPREAEYSWSFPLVRAQIHARLGHREEAFRLLEKAFFQEGRGVARADHTIFDLLPLKGYPPFDELMRGVG